MPLMAHPMTHENERCRDERPLARVSFRITSAGDLPVAAT
jgi:hypothetical protein